MLNSSNSPSDVVKQLLCNNIDINETISSEIEIVECRLRNRFGLAVSAHWDRYVDVIDRASPLFYYGLGTYITIVSVVGIAASTTVVVATLRNRWLQSVPGILVLDLALSELVFAIACSLPMMSVSCFRRRWTFGDLGCEWYAYIGAITGFNSINCLTCIAIDRYLVVIRRRTVRATFVMVSASLAWALIMATPPMIGWSRYIGEGFMVSCSIDYLTRSTVNLAYNYCLMFFGFILPLTVTTSCYASIVTSLHRISSVRADGESRVHDLDPAMTRQQRAHRRKEKDILKYEYSLAKLGIAMVCLFTLSWMPYAIVVALGITGWTDLVTPYSAQFPVLLAKASYCWNPIVYALCQPRYRAALTWKTTSGSGRGTKHRKAWKRRERVIEERPRRHGIEKN